MVYCILLILLLLFDCKSRVTCEGVTGTVDSQYHSVFLRGVNDDTS